MAVDMLERAPSAPPAPAASTSAAASSAAATSVATSSAAPAAEAAGEEEPDTDDDDGLLEHWALCNLCSKYRKLANPFPADEEFYCGHECCECPCDEPCDCLDPCDDGQCPCSECIRIRAERS